MSLEDFSDTHKEAAQRAPTYEVEYSEEDGLFLASPGKFEYRDQEIDPEFITAHGGTAPEALEEAIFAVAAALETLDDDDE